MHLFSNSSKCGKYKEVAQASVSLMFLPLLVLCDLLLNRPTATCNLFVLHNDQKTKKTDTHTCLVPHDLKICAFQSQTQFFVSASSFFPLTYLYTVSSKPFLWSFLAQSRLMAKTFCKIASLFFFFFARFASS